MSVTELRSMPRQEVESHLNFAGFAVFECPIKPESEPSLQHLAESGHRLVMITGDAPHTACYVATQVAHNGAGGADTDAPVRTCV